MTLSSPPQSLSPSSPFSPCRSVSGALPWTLLQLSSWPLAASWPSSLWCERCYGRAVCSAVRCVCILQQQDSSGRDGGPVGCGAARRAALTSLVTLMKTIQELLCVNLRNEDRSFKVGRFQPFGDKNAGCWRPMQLFISPCTGTQAVYSLVIWIRFGFCKLNTNEENNSDYLGQAAYQEQIYLFH